MISWLEKNWRFSALITILIAIFIFYMSSRVFISTPAGFTFSYTSQIYHFSVFFILTFFLLISTLQGKNNSSIVLICFAIAILYSILDELHQYFVPGRYCCIEDILVNSAGIYLATLLYLIKNKII